jgi:hypothetical protein
MKFFIQYENRFFRHIVRNEFFIFNAITIPNYDIPSYFRNYLILICYIDGGILKNFPVLLKIDPLAQWLSQKARSAQITLIISGGSIAEPKKDEQEDGLMTEKFLIYLLQDSF